MASLNPFSATFAEHRIRELQNAARAKREKAKAEGKAKRRETAMASKAIDSARELLTAHAANEAADEMGNEADQVEATDGPNAPYPPSDQIPLDSDDDHSSPVEESKE